MSSANVDITFDTPQDGKVKFTAGPKNADAKTFFMKVKGLKADFFLPQKGEGREDALTK